MVPYITRRIFLLVYVLLGVSLTIFLLMRLIPGDPALVMLGERATAERSGEVRRSLGLDQPLAVKKTVKGYVPHATGGEKLDTVWIEKK